MRAITIGGTGTASSVARSAWPRSAKASICRVTMARMSGSSACAAAGENHAWVRWRHRVCSGGSISSGMAVIGFPKSGTVTPWAELNTSGLWAAS